jgi:hypothetical protein
VGLLETIYRVATSIKSCFSPSPTPAGPPADFYVHHFMEAACQYYTAARFSMRAQLHPVCGNLFHHAVEMALKAGLTQKRSLVDLKEMNHKLRSKVWKAFKEDFPDPALQRHDKTISTIDKVEELRYPGGSKSGSMGITAEWFGQTIPIVTYGELDTPRQYPIVVSDIDDLMVDIFTACDCNPAGFFRSNAAAIEAVTLYNSHAGFYVPEA